MSGGGNTVGKSHAGKVQSRSSQHSKAGSAKSINARPQPLVDASRQALGLQPALKIGKANDPYERQADHIADKVVAGETQLFQRHIAEKPQLTNFQRFPLEDKGLQSRPYDTSRADFTAADAKASTNTYSNAATTISVADGLPEKERPDDRSLQAQEQEREVQAQEEPLQAQEQDTDVRPQQDEAVSAIQRKQQEVQTPQEQDQLQHAQANEREVQAQQVDEEEPLQKKPLADEAVQDNPQQSLHDARQRSGSPLPDPVRDKMERAFSKDFSGVRIHTDDPAVLLNQDLGARALTSGSDIFFNTDEFQPASRQGEHLLAHELTHVVQQEQSDSPVTAQQQPELQPKQEAPESYQIRPELLKAVQNARGKIGLVNAKVTDSDGNRVGWETLNEFFNTAFGGKHPLNEKVIQKIVMGKDKEGNPKDALPSWCGIFVWWSLKTAGLPIPDWKLGPGVLQHFNARPKGEIPRKGDIAYRDENQHFAIVSGVEMQGIIPRIATINGNSMGANTQGGQIQEQWHGMEGWRGFLDTTSKLNLPEVELVTTQRGPDELMPEAESFSEEPQAKKANDETQQAQVADEQIKPESIAAEPVFNAPASADEVTVELPEIPPAPEIEPAAVIEPLSLDGSSDQAVSAVAEASPSQIALDGDKLGAAVSDKLQSEQQQEIQDTPQLQVNLAGNVTEGLTPADQLMPTTTSIEGGEQPATNLTQLTATPHEYATPPPTNAANDQTLDREEQSEGFFGWLRANFEKLLGNIRTTDPGLNTSAGAAPKVVFDNGVNPNEMASERSQRGDELRTRRDTVTENFKEHPGQGNIQAKAVQETKTVEMKSPAPEPVETAPQQPAQDYAEAELPQNVRDQADELLGKQMQKELAEANQQTKDAAQSKQTGKADAISKAEEETERLNRKADDEQRNIVIDNRKKVAEHQRGGIEEAYGEVNNFETEAGKQQQDKNKLISDEVTLREGEAKSEHAGAEKQAKEKKEEAERNAREEKEKLDRERKNQSWWQRAKNKIKNAVKALTSLIDKAFNKIRGWVKDVIDKAKKAAIGLINRARKFIVEKLNDFRQWAKEKVNKYLASTFPGLAARINGAIDSVVDTAIDAVNAAADGAIAAVEFIADNLAAALDKILSVFQAALKAAVQIIGAVLTGDFAEALKIAIRFACELAGIDPQPVFDFIERVGEQLTGILKKPIRFFNNVFEAIGLGTRGFFKNIKDHLVKGLVGWLTGALSEVPLTLPETFDITGIFSIVVQILGITYDNIKARIIAKHPPAEKVFHLVEKSMEVFTVLFDKGPAGLWDMMKDSLTNLEEIVMGAVRNYVITTVIKEAVTWLLGLLNPAGALVKILKLVFDLVMFLVQRFNQIKDFVVSVYDSLSAIASGVVTKAAEAVENAMARSLPVFIGLLASLAGLGGIGKTVQGIIKQVTSPINRIIDTIIEKAVALAKKIAAGGKAVAGKVKEKLVQWWKARKKFTTEAGETHTLFFKGNGNAAVLTMQSEEQTFEHFMDSLDEKDFDAKQKTHFLKARTTAKQIDAKRKEAVTGKDDAEKEKNGRKKEEAISTLLSELGDSTRYLFGDSVPNCGPPKFGGINGDGFGTTMVSDELTGKGKHAKGGTEPTQKPHTIYDNLNLRRMRGGSNFYIRGHLLNQQLGGIGEWENMTPLSRAGNAQHETKVESYVKDGFNAKAIQRYKVEAKYADRSDTAELKKQLQAMHPSQADLFAKIVDAEKSVPTTLELSAERRIKKGDEYKELDKRTWKIANPIERSADQYFLSDTPKIIPVDINSLKQTQPLLDLKHKEIGEPQANAILAAVAARRKEGRPMFSTYEILEKEAMKHSVDLKDGMLKTWNEQGYVVLR